MSYQPEGFSLEIFKKRYAIHENETWAECALRVGSHVSMAETGENIAKYKKLFTDEIENGLFVPGGRTLYASQRAKGQLLNCFVIGTSDSREGWGKTAHDMIVICGTGGGLGANCSPVRPRGTPINGTGGTATGAVSLMEIINAAGEVIKAGGGRRTALMLCLNLDHGDLQEFLDKKLDLNKLNNANISVWFNDNPEDFFKLVKNDGDLELKFRGKVVNKLKAKEVWRKIVSNALKGGEPGLLNGYLFNKMSNISYHAPIVSTNPCGEIGLLEYDCCCLGALVLSKFVEDNGINWDKLKNSVQLAVRFLDNVLTVNNYPLPEIKETCHAIRRIGLGVMGLHDMLLLLGEKYNSDSGIETVDKVLGFIKNCAYETSVDLAVEKGAFPKFDADKYLKGGFAKTLKPSIRTKIKENGIRNCAILTIAPTGTTSIVSGVTSGIEPMFAPAYYRKYRNGEELATEVVIHPLFKKFVDVGRDVSHFQGTYDLSLRDHFEMQRVCQKHLDNACSKTINVPQGTSEQELSDLYMEYFPELKGVTVYPEGSRIDQPLTAMSLDDAIKHVTDGHFESLESYAKDPCRGGSCDL